MRAVEGNRCSPRADSFYGFEELLGGNRLREQRVGAAGGGVGGPYVERSGAERAGGDEDHREAGGEAPERADQLGTRHGGQVQVGQHEVPWLGGGKDERGPGVGGVRDLVAPALGEHVPDELGGLKVV